MIRKQMITKNDDIMLKNDYVLLNVDVSDKIFLYKKHPEIMEEQNSFTENMKHYREYKKKKENQSFKTKLENFKKISYITITDEKEIAEWDEFNRMCDEKRKKEEENK